MAGLGVRLYTDEMLSPRLAAQLRRQGYDVVSCYEAGRGGLGIPDDEQLAYANQEGRAIVTHNARDFVPLDGRWKDNKRAHAGIVVIAGTPSLALLLRWVARHLDTVPPAVQDDTLLWLDTSPLP